MTLPQPPHPVQAVRRRFLPMKRRFKRLVGLKCPYPFMPADVLELVFADLTRGDLVQCMRVSQLWYDIAARYLYGSSVGIEYGDQAQYRCSRWDAYYPFPYSEEWPRRGPKPKRGMDPFMGIAYPHCYLPSPLPSPPPRRIFGAHFRKSQPSPTLVLAMIPEASRTKVELLKYVRHLTYHMDQSGNRYTSPQYGALLPSLETLSFPSSNCSRQPIMWKSGQLALLRPKHVRLTRLPRLDIPCEYPLRSTVGSAVEKITIHVLRDSLLAQSHYRYQADLFYRPIHDIHWPASLKHLDIVFTDVNHDGTSLTHTPGYHPLDVSTQSYHAYHATTTAQGHTLCAVRVAEAIKGIVDIAGRRIRLVPNFVS